MKLYLKEDNKTIYRTQFLKASTNYDQKNESTVCCSGALWFYTLNTFWVEREFSWFLFVTKMQVK